MPKIVISIGTFKAKEIPAYLAEGYIVEAYEPRKEVYNEYLEIDNERFFPFDFAILGEKAEDEVILKIIEDQRDKFKTPEMRLTKKGSSSSTHFKKNWESELISHLKFVDSYPVKTMLMSSILQTHEEIDKLFINCEGEEISIIKNTSIELFQRCKWIEVDFHLQPERYDFLHLSNKDKIFCVNKLSKYFEVIYNYTINRTRYQFVRKEKRMNQKISREWTNQWNPFNSAKALLYRESFEGCAKLNLLPPVTVGIDLSNKCNFDCIWCNALEIMQDSQAMLSKDHILRLADFIAEWGVKAVCAGGGGEPLTNPYAKDLYYRLKENGIGCAPVTNGSLLNDEIIEAMAETSRWVGISMDAGCNDTYMKVKGISNPKIFDITCNNISKLTKRIKELGTKCDVGYKFLLHPLNALEIFEAAKLAKSLGVRDFQLRPVGWDNVLKTKDKGKIDFSGLFDKMSSQIEEAMALEDENFSVYGIRHKFQSNFQRKVSFEKCWASSIASTVFGANGNYNLCLDMRGRKDFVLCSHYPDPYEVLKCWNSPHHIEIIRSINPNECPRCTAVPYQEIVEQVFIKDRMCRKFL